MQAQPRVPLGTSPHHDPPPLHPPTRSCRQAHLAPLHHLSSPPLLLWPCTSFIPDARRRMVCPASGFTGLQAPPAPPPPPPGGALPVPGQPSSSPSSSPLVIPLCTCSALFHGSLILCRGDGYAQTRVARVGRDHQPPCTAAATWRAVRPGPAPITTLFPALQPHSWRAWAIIWA